MMYTGLEYYWEQRLSQGKYVLDDIKTQLKKAYYVDNAISEEEYNHLLTYAEQHVDKNYKPNLTITQITAENAQLKQKTAEQAQIIDEIVFNIIPETEKE